MAAEECTTIYVTPEGTAVAGVNSDTAADWAKLQSQVSEAQRDLDTEYQLRPLDFSVLEAHHAANRRYKESGFAA